MSGKSAWTQAQIDYLTEHWGSAPASAIGKRLGGLSKSAILGKAHRLKLPLIEKPPVGVKSGRSHIRRPGPPRLKSNGATLPPLASADCPSQPRAVDSVDARARVVVTPLTTTAVFPKSTNSGDTPAAHAKYRCCWPIGEPGTPEFRFCGEPAEAPGKSYCAECAKRAYVRRARHDPEAEAA